MILLIDRDTISAHFFVCVYLTSWEISQLSFNNDKGNHLFSESTVGSLRLEMKNEVEVEGWMRHIAGLRGHERIWRNCIV